LFTDKNKIADLRVPLGLRLLRRLTFPKKLGLLGKLYEQNLARQGVGWVKTSAGPVWKLDLRNSTHRWIVFGDYEGPGFIRWARRWVGENSMVVDSAANIGQVLLYLAPKIKTGRYLAFEPFPPAREWLKECLQRYPEWPVKVEEFGLGESVGLAFLDGQWGGESAVGSHTELKFGKGDIRITTLDEYAKMNSLGKIRLWKLDMEGGEEAALKGAQKLLSNRAIEALVLETEANRFKQVRAMLGDYGYHPFGWNGQRIQSDTVSSFGNVLFIASEQSS
jgi:FkbM family methyltransferase